MRTDHLPYNKFQKVLKRAWGDDLKREEREREREREMNLP
jgi:hypothetical protein